MGSPLSKTLVKYATDGVPTRPGKEALKLNAVCSCWMSRIINQMVVWEGDGRKLGFENVEDKDDKWGMILPQVIAMGTVTRIRSV